MKRLILTAVMTPFFVHAQSKSAFPAESNDPEKNFPRLEGKLVNVRVSRGQPTKIFVAGREEAQLDLSKLKLTVRRLKPIPGTTLSYKRVGDVYEVVEPVAGADLEVVTELNNNRETFRFPAQK